MQRLLRRIVGRLRGNRVRARLLVEPPKSIGEGWLLRLRGQNPGKPDDFDATIVAVEGAVPADLVLPWPLAWRGHGAAPRVHLLNRGGELLRLGLFDSARPSTFVLLGLAPAGSPERRCTVVSGDDGIVLTVRIRRGDRVEAEPRIRLSSRPGVSGAFVPVVTIIS